MRIHYKEGTDELMKQLTAAVQDYFRQAQTDGYMNRMMRVKLVVMLGGLFGAYLGIYFAAPNRGLSILFGFGYGLFTFFAAFNLAHDAGHNAVFRQQKYNQWLLYLLNLIGVSSYIFKHKHNRHHYGPNISGSDADIDDFKIGRLVASRKKRAVFRLQAFYLPLAYLFYYFAWVTYKDLLAFRSVKSPEGAPLAHPRRELLKLLYTKLFIFCVHVLLPYLILGLTWQELLLLNVAIYIGPGLMMVFFVIPVHLNTKTQFPTPDQDNRLPYSWSVHQILTTLDYSTQNRMVNFWMGGFNHHVAHHLFASICHCHYPALTPILRQIITDAGIQYQCVPYYRLFPLHLQYLQKMGR